MGVDDAGGVVNQNVGDICKDLVIIVTNIILSPTSSLT